jgi:exportin-T
MENCVRYASVFEAIPQHIGTVLENFVRLIHHDHIRIKSRSWYLFLRFVKHVRQHVGDVAEQVIEAISDLLPIKAPAPDDDNDEDMSSDEQDNSEAALFTKQLYLFQAIGYLSSSSNIPAEKQALYIRTIMGNLFADMEQHLQLAKTGNGQALSQIDHLVLALGTVAQGFSEGMPSASASSGSGRRQSPDKLVTDEFARTAEAILVALGQFNTSLNIRTACRSAFSRLLGILGGNMLPQLPQWIEGLLSESSGKDEMAFFLRILDQVVFEFKGEIYDVLDQLFAPLQQRIFMALKEPIMGTDDQVQLGELRREYLSFILAILSNNLEGTLVSDRNQVCFEQAIACIMELARAFESSASSSKLAFGLMTRMATIWGGPDVANSGAAPSPAIPNFDQFLVEHFHALCWDVINDPNFRPSDAQSRQILAEIATLEATIWAKTGDLMAHHLRRQQSSSPGTGAFLSTLQEGPNKDRILAFFSTTKTLVRAQSNNTANKGVTTG